MPVLVVTLAWLLAAQAPAPAPGTLRDLAGLARLDSPGVGRGGMATVSGTESAQYLVEAAAHADLVYSLPGGPRTVREINVVPDEGTAEAWRLARLRLTWEGDDPAVAGVDLPLGIAFGRVTNDGVVGPARFFRGDGTAWVSRLPMPYRTRALLRIDTERPLAGKIRVRTTRGVDSDAGFFRAVSTVVGRGGSSELLTESGRGHLAGWLLWNERGPMPENPEALASFKADGRDPVPLASVSGLPQVSAGRAGDEPRWGSRTFGASPSSSWAAFRWLDDDPIRFRRGWAVEDRSGGRGESEATGVAARAAFFWYSERPGPGPSPSSDSGRAGR